MPPGLSIFSKPDSGEKHKGDPNMPFTYSGMENGDGKTFLLWKSENAKQFLSFKVPFVAWSVISSFSPRPNTSTCASTSICHLPSLHISHHLRLTSNRATWPHPNLPTMMCTTRRRNKSKTLTFLPIYPPKITSFFVKLKNFLIFCQTHSFSNLKFLPQIFFYSIKFYLLRTSYNEK